MDERFPYEKFERVLDLILAHTDRFLDKLEGWLSKEEAMDYLGIRRSTYYRWVAEGILEPRGKAGQDKFLKADLRELAEERKRRKRRKPGSQG